MRRHSGGTATGSTSISLYQPTTEDVADIAESNIRLGLQRALAKPATSTPEIVANGIRWAKAEPKQRGHKQDDGRDMQWREWAIVMAAALAATRNYEGDDRAEIDMWSRPILQRAAEDQHADMMTRHATDICSNPAAIAALGIAALYHRNPNAETPASG